MEKIRDINLAEQFTGWKKSEVLYGSIVCGLAVGLSLLSARTIFSVLYPLLTMPAYLFYAKGKVLGFIPAAFVSIFQLRVFWGIIPFPVVFTLLLIVIVGHVVGPLLWTEFWQDLFHRTRLMKFYPPMQIWFFLLLAGGSVLALGINWKFGTNPVISTGLSTLFSAAAFVLMCIGLIEHWLVRAMGSLIYLQALYFYAFPPGMTDHTAMQAGISPVLVSALLSLFYFLQFVLFYGYNRIHINENVWEMGRGKKAPYTCFIQSDYPDHQELDLWNPQLYLQKLKQASRKSSKNVPFNVPWERCHFYFSYGFSKSDTLLQLVGTLMKMRVVVGNSSESFWYFGVYQGEQELANLYKGQQFLPGKTEKTLLVDCINLNEPILVRYLNDKDVRLKELKEKADGSAKRLLEKGYLDEFLRLIPNPFLEKALASAVNLPQTTVSYPEERACAYRKPLSKPDSFQEAEK